MSPVPYKRTRIFNQRVQQGVEDTYVDGGLIDRKLYNFNMYGKQTTWSGITHFPEQQRQLRRKRNSPDDEISMKRLSETDFGQDFQSVKYSYSDAGGLDRPVKLDATWIGGLTYTYKGPLYAAYGSAGMTSGFPAYDEALLYFQMKAAGTTAIANTIPTSPAVGAANAIGESMQRLPKLPGAAILGRAGNVSKKFADEYLNYEFGLKPLAADIRKTVQTARDANKILEQLERDSGRLVRRRYSFPVERSTTILSQPGERRITVPALATAFYGDDVKGPYTHQREVEKRMWFSGAYTYFYQTGDDLKSRMQRTEQEGNRLYGARLSPSLAWELAPWSWAADWVTNAGDVMKNLSAFASDGLVLQWGYVMCDMRITDTHTLYPSIKGVPRLEQRFTTHVKRRIRATPFGFGLDPGWSSFTPRQLAILGALGITRGR